jgi:hypothetical protein
MNNACNKSLINLQFQFTSIKFLLRQFVKNRFSIVLNETNRYFRIDVLQKKNSFWQFWKNNVFTFSHLIQMIKNVFAYSISSMKIERVFNLIRKICIWNKTQFNSKNVKQTILIKYYNRIINSHFDEIIIETWNIYRRKKNKNRKNDWTNNDFFKTKLKNVLSRINYFWC